MYRNPFFLALLVLFLAGVVGIGEITAPRRGETEHAPGGKVDPNQMYIAAFDVFGSENVTPADIEKNFGPLLHEWVTLGLTDKPESRTKAMQLENALNQKIMSHYHLAYTGWSLVQDFQPGDHAIYMTLDVVEKKDAPLRMPFHLQKPLENLPDPHHLIHTWFQYEQEGLRLVSTGEIEPDALHCPAFTCPFGFAAPTLAPFKSPLVSGAHQYEHEIDQFLHHASDPDQRAAAVYLASFLLDSGNTVLNWMVEKVSDPDEVVRNNALRVLAGMAKNYPQYVIPPMPLIQALWFPRVTDRSKALYALYQLSLTSVDTVKILRQNALPSLLRLLRSAQPDQKELAFNLMRKVTGKRFPQTDIASWEKGIQKMRETP